MKVSFSKKLTISATLDSSEAVMFNQGGMHKISLYDTDLSFKDFDDVELTIQIERSHQSRHDFILSEALKHKQRVADETGNCQTNIT